MDQHLLKYMMSYWVKHSYQITSNNTQDNIIVHEMSIISSTTLKKIYEVCIFNPKFTGTTNLMEIL